MKTSVSVLLQLFLSLIFTSSGLLTLAPAMASASSVNVWWPTNNAEVTGVQPFKAVVAGLDVSQYQMYWQVDGGQLNLMSDNYTNYQHKEASVDLSGWNWHGTGPYTITFVAKQNGTTIAQQSEEVYIQNDTSVQPATVAQPSSAPVASAPAIVSTSFYVDPHADAAAQALAWSASNPSGAAAMQVLAAQPTAVWFGDWNTNVASDTRALVHAAQVQGTTPVLVAYNIPERDCGGFSSGGSNTPAGYAAWIQALASGIGSANTVVILEPDALAQISCLSSADQQTRLQLLSQAVTTLKSNPNTKVYIDAGHAGWINPSTMAQDLTQANIAQADGFSLNVSNFFPTADQITYGEQISALTGGKHFVIDTSRNGNGSNGQWCNPPGMAIGMKPTTQTGNPLVDAFLWIKTPGESDGTCNGGPAAGVWWPSYALQLVQNAPANTTTVEQPTTVAPATPTVSAPATITPLNVWWPTNNAEVTGVQPFKAVVAGLDVSQYQMYWQVDGGQLNLMSDNYTNYQHKEASVDLSGWNWHGTGPYTITFVAKQNGTTIAQQSEEVYVQ